MKKSILAVGVLLTVFGSEAQISGNVPPAIPVDNAIEKIVHEIVSGMTLDDKVGQMCEINVANILYDGKPEVDPAKLKAAIETYRVGSSQRSSHGCCRAQDLV